MVEPQKIAGCIGETGQTWQTRIRADERSRSGDLINGDQIPSIHA